MTLNIKRKAFLYCVSALGLLVFIVLISKESLLLKTTTPAAFKQLKEKLFGDPFRLHTFGSDSETSIDVNNSVRDIQDYSYNKRINLISRRENINITSNSEDMNTSRSCSPTTFVECYKPTRNVIQTNTSYGIAMLRRPDWMTIPAVRLDPRMSRLVLLGDSLCDETSSDLKFMCFTVRTTLVVAQLY